MVELTPDAKPDPTTAPTVEAITDAETIAALSGLLQTSLRALAAAGEADAACRLGGRACALFRGRNPDEWRRFNVQLHRLSPKTNPFGSGAP